MIDVRTLTGPALGSALDDVATLRIRVFRDWPYLYDGDHEYERNYLQVYRNDPRSILVGAFDGTRLIGASTGGPLVSHASDFADAFQDSGIDLETVFYCAESVLLPAYRGQGIGHAFFDQREAHARALGFDSVAFCAVMRPADHPARPPDYRALDTFWRGRGYAPLDGVIAQFFWKDIGEPEQTAKPLQFWMRSLKS